MSDPIRDIRTVLINHGDPIVRQAYDYIVDLELVSAKQRDDHAAEVKRLRSLLRTLLGLHDAEVFVREPWDTTFDEARTALAGEGDEDA